MLFGWLLRVFMAIIKFALGKGPSLPVGNTAGYQSGRPYGCVVST